MSNDLQSILARHNLRGINVANFSPSSQRRPPPQQSHPYQYPAPVPQQRGNYPWSPTGQGSGNAALGYNIWGKAPVYSLMGEDEEEGEEEEEESDDVEGEERQAAAADEEAISDAQAAAEVEESIETEKPAEDAATETIPVATSSDTGEKDIPPEDPIPDAAAEPAAEESSPDVSAAEQPSDPPQEEATTAIPTASDPPAEEETATESTETAPQESPSGVAPEPIAATQPEEEAEAKGSQPAPSDTIQEVEPDRQDSGEVIEAANPSEGESAASDVPAPVEVAEDTKKEDDNPDSPSEPAQEEQVDASQSPEAGAADLEQSVIDAAEVPPPSSDESHPVESPGGDISQEGLPSHDISSVEEHPTTGHDETPQEAQSNDSVTSPETDETVTAEAPTTADDIQETSPEDSNEIIQVIDVNNNDSTDDTAVVIVVDVNTSDTTPDTNIPPPPPPAPHVTISEPLKPSKSSKKKSSSTKANRSRHGEKLEEKLLEIIPLKEGKAKSVAKGKGKKKVRGKGGKGSEVESVEMIPPPPPPLPIVDVPPPAPSPPPSGHVIEVVVIEEMQVIDETGAKDELEDTVTPDLEVDAAVEQPQIDNVSDGKEENHHTADTNTVSPPGVEDENPDLALAADTAVVAVPDQNEKDELTPATADPSSSPDADASEGPEIEQTVEAEAPEQKDDETSAAMSPLPEPNVIAPALDEKYHVVEAEDLAGAEKEPPTPQEATISAESESNIPSEDPAVESAPQDQDIENSPTENEGPGSTEATIPKAEKLDGAQSEDIPNDVPGAESLTSKEDKPVEPSLPATEEPKNTNDVSDPVVEDNAASGNPTNDPVETATPEPPIEPATVDDSTSEASKEVSTSEASEPDSANMTSTDSAPSEDTGTSSCSDASAPVDETPPAACAEVVAESAPTLMELAALILPSKPVPQSTEKFTATKDESKDGAVDGDIGTKETTIGSEASGSVSDAAVGEDSGPEEDIAVTDQENNENGEHQAPGETTGKVLEGDIDPEVSTETKEPAKIVVDDQEMDQPDSKTDEDHGVDAEHVDEKMAPDQVDKAQTDDKPVVDGSTDSPDGDAQPVQTVEAGDGPFPDAADVQAIDAQDTVVPVEVATESPETPPIASEERDNGSDKSNDNAPDPDAPDAPEAAEAAKDDTENLSSSVTGGPIANKATEAETGDADIPQAEDTGAPIAEAKTPSDPADDRVVEDIAAPAAESENGATRSPVSVHEDATEALESAEVLEEDSAVQKKAEADGVTSQPVVIEEVEDQKPAEELPAEPVAQEPAAESTDDVVAQTPAAGQVEQASETVVVEAADSGACERPEEQDPTKTSEPAAEEDLSAQAAEAKAEHIIEQPADTTEDATPSTTALGAETDQQTCPESPLPVLAEEAQGTEVAEALEHTTPENLSKLEETAEATKPVDTASSLEDPPEPNEESSPGQEPVPTLEEEAVEPPKPEDATREPEESSEEPQPSVPEGPEASVQEPITEAEVLPGDSISQQSRCETISDSKSGRRLPLVEEREPDQPAPEEATPPSPSKHSAKVSFDEPPVLTKGKEPASPSKERRKSSKSSSSNRHSSPRHKVKDVSRPPSDQKSSSAATSSRRRSSTTTTPQSGLFRRLSTTNSRSSRAEAAEQAEIRRRAAELAAREQEVQRQLERARKRAALEAQEQLLREKEEELARLRAAEKEKKRARREEQRRREQEALEHERLARERAEEEARAKELERAERRRRRRESERVHHGDDRARAHRHSSNRESKVRDISPTAKPKTFDVQEGINSIKDLLEGATTAEEAAKRATSAYETSIKENPDLLPASTLFETVCDAAQSFADREEARLRLLDLMDAIQRRTMVDEHGNVFAHGGQEYW
ncbi:hypothetical protein KCU77_g1168, partial [Aureobasidium melanogenum]